LVQICYIFIPTGTVAGWCKEHPVEYSVDNLFVELGKKEMHSYNTRLLFIEIGDTSL
jgi:hypothetical protein